jgi:hypothetical protein
MVRNNLALLIAAVKSFIVQAQGRNEENTISLISQRDWIDLILFLIRMLTIFLKESEQTI